MIKTIMGSLILMNLVDIQSLLNNKYSILATLLFSLLTLYIHLIIAGYIMNRLGQSLNVDQVKVCIYINGLLFIFFHRLKQHISNFVFKGNDQLRRPEQGRENIIRRISEAND